MSPEFVGARSFSRDDMTATEAKLQTLDRLRELLALAETMKQPAFVIALTDGAGPERQVQVLAGYGHPLHQLWCVGYMYSVAPQMAAQLRGGG